MDDSLSQEIAALREWMIEVHYFEESHWLAAAVAFPGLCHTPVAQAALRRAITIAWEMGYYGVAHWLNTTVASQSAASAGATQAEGPLDRQLRLPPLPDLI